MQVDVRTAPEVIAYLTDVEGRWDKLEDFARESGVVALGAGGALDVADGARLVFGGDAVDRGPAGLRVVRALVDLARRKPDRCVLLAGNRDINKLRLRAELSGAPPHATPPEVAAGSKGELVRWIFRHTMGARDAFEHRARELSRERGQRPKGDEVARSFVEDVAPGGAMLEYLLAAQLAYRRGSTLFVHGAVTAESLGVVPTERGRTSDVAGWIERLNAFYRAGVLAFAERDARAGYAPETAALIDYQAPIRGTRENQASVVYGRPFDAAGRPELPGRDVTEALGRAGISRLVVGHTPCGQCPALVREDGFELVLGDNSYSALERGSTVLLSEASTWVASRIELEGREVDVRFSAAAGDAEGPLGKLDAETGDLVKARLASGDYLVLHALGGFRFEERAAAADALAHARLVSRLDPRA